MAFIRKRGRPRNLDTNTRDFGTVELRRHRSQHHTVEPIDLLHQQEAINDQQHWCAIHFRWLYTLRYGNATVTAVDPAQVKGILHKKHYSEWQTDRENEWKEAVELLGKHHLYSCLLNIAVHHRPPITSSERQKIILALQLLCEYWCKPL